LSGCATQVAASKHAAAIERGAPERCFGVARGGRNDCKTDAHVCAGWAYHDADPQAFVYVPAGPVSELSADCPTQRFVVNTDPIVVRTPLGVWGPARPCRVRR